MIVSLVDNSVTVFLCLFIIYFSTELLPTKCLVILSFGDYVYLP